MRWRRRAFLLKIIIDQQPHLKPHTTHRFMRRQLAEPGKMSSGLIRSICSMDASAICRPKAARIQHYFAAVNHCDLKQYYHKLAQTNRHFRLFCRWIVQMYVIHRLSGRAACVRVCLSHHVYILSWLRLERAAIHMVTARAHRNRQHTDQYMWNRAAICREMCRRENER